MKSIKSFDGTKISYVFHPGKEIIVFLHGLACNHTFWNKEINYFKRKGYGILAIDLRGHWSSDKPKKKYVVKYFAKDLKAVLEKEKIKKITLVGHSLGGIISLVFYKNFPGFVKDLILVNSTYKVSRSSIRRGYEFFIRHRLDKPLFEVEKLFMKPKKPNVDVTKAKNVIDLVYDTNFISPREVVEACAKSIIGFDMTDFLDKIKVPVLVLAGKTDEVFSNRNQKEMCKRIDDCELVFLECGHSLPLKRADLVSKEIFKFLTQ